MVCLLCLTALIVKNQNEPQTLTPAQQRSAETIDQERLQNGTAKVTKAGNTHNSDRKADRYKKQ